MYRLFQKRFGAGGIGSLGTVAAAIIFGALLPLMTPAQPASLRPPVLKDVGIDQLLNSQVPPDLVFTDENGRQVRLADYFGDKPIVLSLVYYDCPQLCTQVLTGLLGALKTLPMTPGSEFISLTVSFDPREKSDLAAAKKKEYVERLRKPQAASGWHFLTGDEPQIQALTRSVGFRYVWDQVSKQFAHASGIMILTPDGRVSRYLYGIEYAPRDLRFGLLEASDGKIGSLADQIILYCYQYDPTRGTYGLVLMRVLRIFAGLTLVSIIGLILFLRYKVKKKEASQNMQSPGSGKPDSRIGYSHMIFLPLPFIQIPFMPEQASTFAWEVDLFYLFLAALTAFFSIGVAIFATVFMIKYKRRRADEIPEQVEGAMALEITWTVIPFLISMFIFAWGAKLYYQMYKPPTEALEIFVTGKQWMWRAQHPDGMREINMLHVPVGRRVKLTMTSEDVLHSYFIPAFRTKADVVPGRYTTTWFEPTKPGTYHLFCAEYCGTQHSGMIGSVVVMDPADYQAWLSGGTKEASPSAAGQKLFASLACNTCHYEENRGRGPTLVGLYGTEVKLANGSTVIADDAYIRESILMPGAKVVGGYSPIMPTFQGQISEEQILQIIAYLKSIGPKQDTNGASAPPPAPSSAGVKPAQDGQAAQPKTE
ncbi:MAG: cytochrome c oxidase subunit II [Blastocatellales bacterium]